MTVLYIGIAGALGSVSRYLLGSWVARLFHRNAFPLSTFAVNVLGSLLIGFLMGTFAARGEMDSRLRMALTIGFLGGFTTYSTFALETVELVEQRSLAMASLYVTLTLLSAALACFVGLSVGRRM